MKAVDECLPCILRRAKNILQKSNYRDPSTVLDTIEAELIQLQVEETWLLNNKSKKICPAQYGSIRQQILESHGLGDTYLEEKVQGKKIGKTIYNRLNNTSLNLEESLIISVVGNSIEFDPQGVDLKINIDMIWDQIENQQKDENMRKQVRVIRDQLLSLKPGNLLFIFDNVGEEYFDFPLLRELKKMGWYISGVVKGKPVLNDLTVEDIDENPLDMKIYNTGSSDVGFFISRVPSLTRKVFESSDLIISKGMANFETLSSEVIKTDTLYLFRAKCEPVAHAVNCNYLDFIIHFQLANIPWIL